MDSNLYGLIGSDRAQQTVFFFIRCQTGSVYYVLSSKHQAYELFDRTFNANTSESHQRFAQEIRRSDLPERTDGLPIHFFGAAAHLLDDPISKFDGTVKALGKYSNLLFAYVGVLLAPPDHASLLVFCSRGATNLFVFYSKEQGENILTDFNRSLDLKAYNSYRHQIFKSRLPDQTKRPLAHLTGYLATYVGCAIQATREKMETSVLH